MDEAVEVLQREIDNLTKHNQSLKDTINELDGSVTRLQDMKEALEDIKIMESSGLDELENQLESSKRILNSVRGSLRGTILQNMMSIIFAIDRDNDYTLNDHEIDAMINKIERLNGVDVNDKLCKKIIIDHDRKIDGVMELVRDIIEEEPSDLPIEEKMFRFLDTNTVASNKVDSVSQSRTRSPSRRFKFFK